MNAKMNQGEIRRDWPVISKQIHENWPRLDQSDLDACFETIEHLPERILMQYDWDLERAQSQFEEFRDTELAKYTSAQMYDERKPGAEVPAEA